MLGGYAVNFHGHHRNTQDLDIWIAIDPANAERVSEALQRFGFPPDSVPAEKFMTKGRIHAFGREPLRVDILTAPSGVDFDACYERRIEAVLDGVKVNVIALDDLQANKRASGRPKDVADTDELSKLPTLQASQPKKQNPRTP